MITMVAMVILLFFVLDGGIGGEASAPSISFPQNKCILIMFQVGTAAVQLVKRAGGRSMVTQF